jgi:HNH endonuclease
MRRWCTKGGSRGRSHRLCGAHCSGATAAAVFRAARTAGLDAHHVDHWARGGETTLGNLLLLCRRHHRAVHEGGFHVDLDGRFFYPWGGEIEAVPRLPRGQLEELTERTRARAIDDRTCDHGTGERMDLAATVDYLLRLEQHTSEPAHAVAV